MEEFDEDLPDLIVSHKNKIENESDSHYHNPEFVRVDGQQTHIWVGGIHFVEDSDGEIAEGQYHYWHIAGIHTIHQIKEVSKSDKTTQARIIATFEEGNGTEYFPYGDKLELLQFYHYTGDLPDGSIGDGEVMFLKRVD